MSDAAAQARAGRAVIYLRVSTPGQAAKGGEPEGYSLPAQRAACERKASERDASVVEEFADAGASAKTADRPELQRMLAYLRSNPVDFVIVHKVNRAIRTQADAVMLAQAVKASGAQLVSVTEPIDGTPQGILIYGIMSSIAEFDNASLATEVLKGMTQKAKFGGTPGKPGLGYLNVSKIENGQIVVRTIEADPVRGPLMSWAFDACATGEWSLNRLTAELERRGLLTRPTRKNPAGVPLSRSQLHRLLHHPYYRGVVVWQDVEYPGKHPPLVSNETWQRVQDVLAARHLAGERQRCHLHHLIGSLRCGYCHSRLIISNARSSTGRIYPYFVCAGRHQKRTSCDFKAVLINTVEENVTDEYADHQLTETQRQETEQVVSEELASFLQDSSHERKRLLKQRERLLAERGRLIRAHLADAIPLDHLKNEHDRIRDQLAGIEEQLHPSEARQELIDRHLKEVLGLLNNTQALYLSLARTERRAVTQALFTRIEIKEKDSASGVLAEPFKTLLGRRRRRQRLTNDALVILAGHLSNPSQRLRKALDLYRAWQSEQRPDAPKVAHARKQSDRSHSPTKPRQVQPRRRTLR